MQLEQMLVRCGYVGNIPGAGNFTLAEDGGYIKFTWPGGKVTRMEKAANRVDMLVPLPDGGHVRISRDTIYH
jgi:hypothetical protein